ncbi:energy transducer TonB [Pontibacter sp. H259]|uniref:energy transducer TonB n=1 Tax=Pontibacter sp. H259 TaxID=3133421 RepID=UPI0030C253EC
MKAFYTLLFTLSVCFGTLAQDKTAPKTKSLKATLTDHTLTYTVLRDAPSVKHGPYVMQGRNWKCEGQYDMGNRSGVWAFYDWQGNLDYKFDFSKNEEVYANRKSDTLRNEIDVYTAGKYVKMEVDNRPFYMGGESRMMAHLARNIRYPAEAVRAHVQGMAVIAIEINEAGQATAFEIKEKVGAGLEEEALRVVRMLPHEWVPAMVDGKPVTAKIYVPVRFSIR